jgi:hypothetical protein
MPWLGMHDQSGPPFGVARGLGAAVWDTRCQQVYIPYAYPHKRLKAVEEKKNMCTYHLGTGTIAGKGVSSIHRFPNQHFIPQNPRDNKNN